MERQEYLKLESLKKILNDNYLTILSVMEDRISYGLIVLDTAVSPSVLSYLMETTYIGIELKEYDGLERLCFYYLKDS